MTSKISYFKFIESDIRHRGWLAALTAVLLLLLMPVYTLISLDGMKMSAPYTVGSKEFIEWAASAFPGLLNGAGNSPFAVFIGIAGLLCAVTGFSYLHSRDKQDFYHGMPLSRFQWCTISYVGGLIIFIVPYLVFGICTILIGHAEGLMDQRLFITCLTAMLGGILGFLLCYHTGILAMFLTGRIVTGVLASLVLFVYGGIIISLYDGLAGSFFKTWSYNAPNLSQSVWDYSSPGSLFLRTLFHTALSPLNPVLILCTFLCILLMLGAAMIISRLYPAEAAENAIAFSKSAPFIKILIAVPTALFIGLGVKSIYGSETRWIIFISILAVLLLCLLIEFIYHQDLKQLLAGKISTAVSLGGVIIILCILQFDLAGYDSYLPKENKLTNMSVYTDNFSGYFTYPESYNSLTYDQLTAPGAAITDYAPLYRLAGDGIDNLEQGITPSSVDKSGNPQDYINIKIRYGLKGDKNIYRRYAVDRTDFLSTLEQLCKNESYRKELFPVFHLDREEIRQISAQDIYCQPKALSLSKSQQNQLLDAYEKDVLGADIADLQYESPLGELSVDRHIPVASAGPSTANTTYATKLGQFYVYSTYKNTLDLLEKHGYSFRTKIDPEDVMVMNYYPNEGTNGELARTYNAQPTYADSKFGGGIPIEAPEEIQQILDNLKSNLCSGILGDDQIGQGSVEITLSGKAYPNNYILLD